MSSKLYDLSSRERQNIFPFQVQSVYYCWDWTPNLEAHGTMDDDFFEISVRLSSSQSSICQDEINGRICNINYPHVLLKLPGSCVRPTQLEPRDTISFRYMASNLEALKKLDMIPEHELWEFRMTPAIETLLRDFQRCLYTLYNTGAPEEMDWICFKLLRELSHSELTLQDDAATVIKNLSIWIQMHFAEKFTTDELARRCGMSRANFYLYWGKTFDVSPVQYVIDLRLQAAAALLLDTPFAVTQIAGDVGFCSAGAFHRKFKARYGCSPAQYRKNLHSQQRQNRHPGSGENFTTVKKL